MNLEQILNELKQYYSSRDAVLFGYLFGSYAKNRSRVRSDLDIAIYLANYNRELAFEYKCQELTLLQKIFKKPVDLILVNEAPPLLKHEIFRNGIVFIEREHSFLVEYQVKSYYQYLDQVFIINRFFEKNKTRIQEV